MQHERQALYPAELAYPLDCVVGDGEAEATRSETTLSRLHAFRISRVFWAERATFGRRINILKRRGRGPTRLEMKLRFLSM